MTTEIKLKNNNYLKDSQYLLQYRKDIESQFGEDGIIEEIFKIVEPTSKWCVEFGAWDGKHFSNTYNLIANNGWTGVLIEGDKNRCEEIKKNHTGNKIIPINAFVGWEEGENSLDTILAKTEISHNFDFLSIDIDGVDYHVWDSLKKYKPKVVVIEFNATIPSNIEFVQARDFKVKHGHSILSLTKLAKEKGYELISINQENAFYVDKKYFSLFKIQDNSIDSLIHFREPLQVFQLYDGTMVYHGEQYLYYYNIAVDLNRFYQPLPAWIRKKNLMWDIAWQKNPITKAFYTFLLRLIRRVYRPKVIRKRGPFDWKQEYNK